MTRKGYKRDETQNYQHRESAMIMTGFVFAQCTFLCIKPKAQFSLTMCILGLPVCSSHLKSIVSVPLLPVHLRPFEAFVSDNKTQSMEAIMQVKVEQNNLPQADGRQAVFLSRVCPDRNFATQEKSLSGPHDQTSGRSQYSTTCITHSGIDHNLPLLTLHTVVLDLELYSGLFSERY